MWQIFLIVVSLLIAVIRWYKPEKVPRVLSATLVALLFSAAVIQALIVLKKEKDDQAWKQTQSTLMQRVLAQSGDREELAKVITAQAHAMREDLPVSPDEFAQSLIEQIPTDLGRLEALATASNTVLDDLRLKWDPVCQFTESLIEERLEALQKTGVTINVTKPNVRPALFEVLDGWRGGANPSHNGLVARLDKATVRFEIHPGAIIQGKLSRHAQLLLRSDWDSGAGEPFLQLSIFPDRAEYMITTDGISRTRKRAKSLDEDFEAELNTSIDIAVTECIKYALLAAERLNQP